VIAPVTGELLFLDNDIGLRNASETESCYVSVYYGDFDSHCWVICL